MSKYRFLSLAAASLLLLACSDDEPGAASREDEGTGADAAAEGGGIQTGTLIHTASGDVQGDVDGGARRFRGIPYAKPPVGDLRWKPPAPVEPWQGVKDATQFGAACAQPGWIQGDESLAEDCLFLNVWTPDPAPAKPLPVMVWLPGGGNQNGSASDLSPLTGGNFVYDGRDLAATRDVIVVTLNYRLNVFGFFSHPELGAEGSNSGNQGLLDQQAALGWVRDNIAAFGGNPDDVTLFGESAGAQDTCLQVISPGAKSLFHRAISESGGCTTFRKPKSTAESQAAAFATALGCTGTTDVLACLRGKTAKELMIDAPVDGAADAPGGSQFSGGTPRWDFNPVVDGTVIPDQPRALVEAGNFSKVPYLLGSNFEEGRLFFLGATPVATAAEYEAAVTRLFQDRGPDVIAHYPASAFAAPQDALVRVWGDYRLVCSTYDTARRVVAHGTTAHHYDFARVIPGLEVLQATHGTELPYVFGTLKDPGADDVALSDTMQAYWTRFAETGDPNGDGALEWPAFDPAAPRSMNFEVDPSVVPDFRKTECAFWDTIYDAAFP